MNDQVPQLDVQAALTWIRTLHEDTGGLITVNSHGSDGGATRADWHGRFYDLSRDGTDEAITRYLRERDRLNVMGVYLGQSSVLVEPAADSRTTAGGAHKLPGLWMDGDIAGPAHEWEPCEGGADCTHPSKKDGPPHGDPEFSRKHAGKTLPLPPDADAMIAVAMEAGYPLPTHLQDSGNGLNGYWLFDEPQECIDGKRGFVGQLSERFQRQLEAAGERVRDPRTPDGVKYGPLPDLARVMRLHGTVNRKPGTPGGARMSAAISGGTGRRFTVAEFETMIERAEAKTAASKVSAVTAPTGVQAALPFPAAPLPVDRVKLVQENSPQSDFNRRADWIRDVFGPHGGGWQVHSRRGAETYMTRPGKDIEDGHSAVINGTGADQFRAFSSNCEPFTQGEGHTKSGAIRALLFGGAAGDPDFIQTNRWLRAKGYGDPLPPRERPGPPVPVGAPDDDMWAVPPAEASEAAPPRPTEEEAFVERQRMVKRAQKQIETEEEQARADQRKIRLTPASAFRLKAVKWVWEGRMPLGEITLVPGREGAGKSTFLAWMAATVTRGELPGMHFEHPRAVLYAATEDSWEYTIAPRLLAAGADMDLVYRVDVVEVDAGRFGKLSMPVDNRALVDAAHEVKAAMLMCDPIISIIDEKINTFKAQELRSALEPLKRAAEEAEMALVGLVHFNKTKDTDVLSMISGSRAWAEVARAVVAIAVDKDADEYTCVVSQVKNNLGRSDLPHLKYTIRSKVLRAADHAAADEDVEIGCLAWTGESDRGVEELLGPPPSGTRTGDVTNAVTAFIAERFTLSGRVPMSDISAKFPDESPENLRKVLSRAVNRGALKRPARGFYEPGDEQPRPCPGCRRPLPPGLNFCRGCSQSLDGSDPSALRSASDGW